MRFKNIHNKTSIEMNSTLLKKYNKENNSARSKVVKKVIKLGKEKCINTLTPNFNYKNQAGDVIVANTCIDL